MRYDPQKHRRRSIRLPGYDYTSPGAYFVTICTYRKGYLFENPAYREIVEEEWVRSADIRAEIELDEFVVMPNHVHGIVWIVNENHRRGARPCAPTNVPFGGGVRKRSLGSFIRGFKSAVKIRINRIRKTPGEPVWQRNYYEHVIRNEDELNLIRRYIRINPLKWQYDRENPSRLIDEDYERDWGWVEKPVGSGHFRGNAPTSRKSKGGKR